MDKQEFFTWIKENYNAFNTHMDYDLLVNVLDYADGMDSEEQYNYLCQMIPQVPESVIRTVSY